MLHTVVESGTGRRALIPGVQVAGKTGTTNAYRDAWFVGFTGNFTTAVWLGNDNYQPTKQLTGGILPAMTWAKYMRVAMAYEVPKPLLGLPPPEPSTEPLIAEAEGEDGGFDPGASGRLAPETSDALGRLEDRFSKAAGNAPFRQASLGPDGPVAR
jgi:penicillin-binding protein 1A